MGLISEEDLRPPPVAPRPGVRHTPPRRLPAWPRRPSGNVSSAVSGQIPTGAVVQATAAARREPEAFLDKPTHHFPVPIRQAYACLFGQRLYRSLQLGLLVPVEGGGEPPDCSKPRAVGPALPKAVTHVPMVWGSRSSASATAEEVQPWAKSQRACHRSRSRGVGARYMRSRRSPTSSCRRSRSSTMSHIPNTTATRLLLQNTATPLRV